MDRDSLAQALIQTKLAPPRVHQRTLQRPRVTARLLEALDHRLTIVQAGAGYGKTTALASLILAGRPADGREPSAPSTNLAWYHLEAEDTDPHLFLLHLIHSLGKALPELSQAPLARLEAAGDIAGDGPRPWAAVVDLLCNELAQQGADPLLLVLDNAHVLNRSPLILSLLDRLIGRAPPDVHVVLSTRHPIDLPNLSLWLARGEVLEIGRAELAFRTEEIAALFQSGDLSEHRRSALTSVDIRWLAAQTEGWPIALQLVRQGLRTLAVGPDQGITKSGRAQDKGDDSSLSRAPQPAVASSRLPGLFMQSASMSTQGQALDRLFAYLAQEVLAQQPSLVQQFLLATSVLRELAPDICDCVRDSEQVAERASAETLRYLLDAGLFVIELDQGYARYHHLFREFLVQRMEPELARTFHRRAADCFRRRGNHEEAVHHLLAAGAYQEAADILSSWGRSAVRAGRLDTLAGWIQAVPPEVLHSHPPLLVYLGDIARLQSRFDEALGWYRQAEELSRLQGDARGIGQALRGQARVYLDTVNPSQAEHLLQEALRLSDGHEDRDVRIRLLELLAENRLNLGKLEDAERFRLQAQALREEGPTEAELSVRVLIRTGRLHEARRQLQAWADAEQRDPVLRPRAHRETLLLLSLVESFLGEAEPALRHAVEGKRRGAELRSPFITAVGFMRQGHALLLSGPSQGKVRSGRVPRAASGSNMAVSDLTGPQEPLSSPVEQARSCYEQAIAMADSLAVPRLKVEAYWGLCRVNGYSDHGISYGPPSYDGQSQAAMRRSRLPGASESTGTAIPPVDLEAAAECAVRGVEIAQHTGDEWIVALIRLTQGAGLVQSGRHDEGLAWLAQALSAFRECSDTYGEAMVRLWQCLVWLAEGDEARLAHGLDELLQAARVHSYDALFTRKTLLGPPDPRRLVPLLLAGRSAGGGRHQAYCASLLASLGLSGLEHHPGYQLRVQALGAFRVWRGSQEIVLQEWQREKARQLFLVLVTHRRRLLEREEIIELLWPDLPPEVAERDFKVALATLYKVLEPDRQPRLPSAFIVRDGSHYGQRAGADLWLDADHFEQLVRSAEAAAAQQLLASEQRNPPRQHLTRHSEKARRAFVTSQGEGMSPLDGSQTQHQPGASTSGQIRSEGPEHFYQQALALYRGDYLEEYPYDEWCSEERERLLTLYLRSAERLARRLADQQRWEAVIDICQAMLARDDCWEEAYRLLMLAHSQLGNRTQAARAYLRCQERLRAELDVAPSLLTTELYQQVVAKDGGGNTL